MDKNKTIAIIGLGYVGFPLANAFSKKYKVIGFDVDKNIIDELKKKNSSIIFTNREDDLNQASVFIIAVPTPIDNQNNPDIESVLNATLTVGKNLKKGDLVIYESTFYPGLTEEQCIPILESESGLKQKDNFYVGYSPERINPGDNVHTFENIVKVVSGIDDTSLNLAYNLYKEVLLNEPFKVSSIKVAEACKIFENTQRDVNIALVNEISKLFKKMNIDVNEVLSACNTKWNALGFNPGLVGGHCIGVDPYYLIYKGNELNEKLRLIETSREVNESMKEYILKIVLNSLEKYISKSVIVYGVTFKQNVNDIRNSKIIEIARELEKNNVTVYITDPYVSVENVNSMYGTNFLSIDKCNKNVQCIIFGVSHDEFRNICEEDMRKKLENENDLIIDLYNTIKKERNSKIWSI